MTTSQPRDHHYPQEPESGESGTRDTQTLLQLFARDHTHCPHFDRAAEYTLACQLRSARLQLVTSLTAQNERKGGSMLCYGLVPRRGQGFTGRWYRSPKRKFTRSDCPQRRHGQRAASSARLSPCRRGRRYPLALRPWRRYRPDVGHLCPLASLQVNV
jgi:hypothetical protein